MQKLTKRFVESINPDVAKRVIFWDSELKGFGVIVYPTGRLTYCVQYRNEKRIKKRLKLGVHGQSSTEEARILARKHLGGVAHGQNPVTEKKENRSFLLIKGLAEDYMNRYAVIKKRARSVKEDKKLIDKIILPTLKNQPVKHLSRRTVEQLHNQLKYTPYQANRILAMLSKMFSLAVAWGWRENNPIKGIERFQEEKRDRWLNEEELNRFWETLENHPKHPLAFALKLLLLTGSRKGEVIQATWDQFDLEKGIWTKPSHITKQKKREHLPLSIQALETLENLKKLSTSPSLYLFPNERETIKPLLSAWFDIAINALMTKSTDQVEKLWFVMDELAALQNLPRLHTGLAESRKYGGCFLVGFQSKPQLEEIYGRDNSESMLDLFNTKLFFRCTEPSTQTWISRVLGEKEEIESQESISYGAHSVRDDVSLSHQTRQKPLFLFLTLKTWSVTLSCLKTIPVRRLRWSFSSCKTPHKWEFNNHGTF